MWLGCRGPGGPLILGTLVPVEEPSTASKPVLPDFSGPLILRAQTPGLYLNRPHLKVTSAFSAG